MPEKNNILDESNAVDANQTDKVDESIKTTKKADKKIEVSEKLLRELLERDTEREEHKKKVDAELEMLRSIADVGRKSAWENENKEELIRKYRVATWRDSNGKPHIVLTWHSTRDESWVDNGVAKYHQYAKYFLDNGAGEDPIEVEIEQLQFARNKGVIEGEVIKESSTPKGEYKTLRFVDGREIEFDIRFLNA